MLLILEDNSERVERFTAILQTIAPTLPFRVWRDAYAMMREAGPLLTFASMISLDHDLEPESNAPDPGDGYMVTKWLVSQSIICPVIIHSSNGERASWMAGKIRSGRLAILASPTDWRRLD